MAGQNIKGREHQVVNEGAENLKSSHTVGGNHKMIQSQFRKQSEIPENVKHKVSIQPKKNIYLHKNLQINVYKQHYF